MLYKSKYTGAEIYAAVSKIRDRKYVTPVKQVSLNSIFGVDTFTGGSTYTKTLTEAELNEKFPAFALGTVVCFEDTSSTFETSYTGAACFYYLFDEAGSNQYASKIMIDPDSYLYVNIRSDGYVQLTVPSGHNFTIIDVFYYASYNA